MVEEDWLEDSNKVDDINSDLSTCVLELKVEDEDFDLSTCEPWKEPLEFEKSRLFDPKFWD